MDPLYITFALALTANGVALYATHRASKIAEQALIQAKAKDATDYVTALEHRTIAKTEPLPDNTEERPQVLKIDGRELIPIDMPWDGP